MADWFKVFENGIDETRFQYAIHKLQEVHGVWMGILSECCRHKSDTVRWGDNEIELFGFSQRLNISIPKVNDAINILVEIDYLKRGQNTLKVLAWKEKQSDYCQRINRQRPNSVRTVSEQCIPRGEESRSDEMIVDKSTKTPSVVPFLPEEVIFWNSQETLPKVQSFSAGRQKSLKARKTDLYFVEHYKEAVVMVTQSKFCMGQNDRGWKADFDWMLRPETVTKIMEGKYGERTTINNGNQHENSRNAGTAKPVNSTAEAARRLQAKTMVGQVAKTENSPQLPLGNT